MKKSPPKNKVCVNKNGIALISVLMLTGIFSIIFMAVTRLVSLNRNMFNEIASNINVDDLNAQIFLLLLDRNACFETFSIRQKASPRNIPQIRDASNTNAFIQGNNYAKNVTLVSLTASNYTQNVAGILPFNATFDITALYRVPYGDGASKEKTRVFQIRTIAPTGATLWVDGTPLAETTARCVSAGDLAGSYINMSDYISRTGADVKTSNLNMNNGNLIVNGSATLNGAFRISDQRLKEGLTPYHFPLSSLSHLNGYSFFWKQSNTKDMGFVAQEVEKIVPESVMTNQATGLKMVDYGHFVAILLDVTQSLERENIKHEKQIQELEKLFTK